ncbi:TIGR03067 domain-containing protein [Planctomicrobium sp. SH661]|uniref:TIGR03067 domain-containing protein n=1 Tax=Planctomicrobium sp. SH661 TaxID=3448124 RepID=UPI003F5C1AF2
MGRFLRFSLSFLYLFSVGTQVWAQVNPQSLVGYWVVTDLVEDGKVIPKLAIPEWLPSSGKMEIGEGAILFKSHIDGQVHARLFSVDGTRIPNVIKLTNSDQTQTVGIIKMDGSNLVVCLSGPGDTVAPTDFSAEAGSKRMLMVLQRDAAAPPAKPAPAVTAEAPPAPPSPPAATVVTDADIAKLLVGVWKFDDHFGSIIVKYNADGTYTTTRSVEEMRLFKLVFIETPLSAGTWKVVNSQLLCTVTSSITPDRLGHTFPFTVRSISPTDFIFVDYFGRVGQAKRVVLD